MPARSAGLVMYRRRSEGIEVLLAHPGGPFWAKKDLGTWSIPKGEFLDDEEALVAAQREFREETGTEATSPFIPLGSIRQKSAKPVYAWAFEGDCDPAELRSNLITIEWPPKSGRQLQIPEVDRLAFFKIADARAKILPAQFPLLERLAEICG